MKNKISFKLIVLILAISFTVTFISVYIQITNQYQNKITHFEKNLDNMKRNSIPTLSQALWNVDTEAVNIFLNNLITDEKIILAQIIESDGNTISVGKSKKTDFIKKEFEVNKISDSKTYKMGKLIIIADLSPLYEELKDTAINIIITEVIKMLLISLSIIFILRELLTNPLEEMANYANKLSLKTLDQPLVIHDQKNSNLNELDIVTKAINAMRINLINQIKESEEKNNLLAQQSKLAAMGEMIGNIAHQWRQPLSLITTTSSGMQVEYEAGLLNQKKMDNYSDQIVNAANYLSNTIDDFRDFFKPNKDKKHFKIINSFEKTLSLVDAQFKNKDINIIKNIDDIELYGFENELIQVLINILNNAKDELIKKEDQKRLIFIDVFYKDDHIHINIKDNAGGIKNELIDRIFEPYFTTKHQSQGTGIGLYMSEEIITKHMKGTLNVHNVDYTYEDIDYKGAEFNILIDKTKGDK